MRTARPSQRISDRPGCVAPAVCDSGPRPMACELFGCLLRAAGIMQWLRGNVQQLDEPPKPSYCSWARGNRRTGLRATFCIRAESRLVGNSVSEDGGKFAGRVGFAKITIVRHSHGIGCVDINCGLAWPAVAPYQRGASGDISLRRSAVQCFRRWR